MRDSDTLYGPNGTLARFTASCARIHDLAERTRAVAVKSKAGQVREAVREAMKGEPLAVRVAAYEFHNSTSDEALERLARLLK